METTDESSETGPAHNPARQAPLAWVRTKLLELWKPVEGFLNKDPMTLAASIAFYSALSFAPILVIGMFLAAQLSPGLEQRLIEQIGDLLGSQVREIAVVVARHSDQQLFQRSAAGVVSLVVLFISATTSFAQLQAAINRIWDVRVETDSAVWSWLRRRLLSFGMIAVIGFLLLTTLILSTLMAIVLSREGSLWSIANEVITLVVFSGAFAGLFRYVPDARAPWRFVVLGGIVTAMLFELGKWALGAYLGKTSTADAYGAASSMILLLVWVYYSSIIVLIGAALTRGLADRFGDGVGELEHSRNNGWSPTDTRNSETSN